MNRRRAWQWVEVSAIIVIWGLVALALVEVIPVFDEVFSDFGDSLPAPTMLVLRASHFMHSWWLTVVCVALTPLGVFQKKRIRRPSTEAEPEWERLAVRLLIASGLVVLLLIFVALHLPIYTIGDVVAGAN